MQDQNTAIASATWTPSPTGLLTGGCVAEDTAAQLDAIMVKRGAAYIRESSEEQGEGFSPERNVKRFTNGLKRTGSRLSKSIASFTQRGLSPTLGPNSNDS
jgi:hypothetical protein